MTRTAAAPTARPGTPPRPRVASRSLPYGFGLGVVLAVAAFNVLWRMGDQNIGDWDEGRHAVSAYEMLMRGDLLVNTWRGQPDLWNLKPPLSFLPEIISFAAFGPSTFALRLPSALFFLVTVACVAVFARHALGRAGSLIAAAAVATCYPVIGSHSGRTADPDALFVMLTTVALLAVFGAPERPRLLLLWTSAFSGAFLTKSWHAGLVLLIGGVFLLIRGRRTAVRSRDWAIAALGLLPIIIWAAARFLRDGTDFFVAMVQYDLLSRSSGTLEANGGGPLFYLERVVYLAPWILLLAVPVLTRAVRRPRLPADWRTSAWIGPLVAAVLILGLFSLASTKLPWYAYPAFPMLALLIGAIGAAVVRSGTRRAVVLTLVASVLAAGAGEAYVLRKIPAPTSQAQTALSQLRDRSDLRGVPVWLDPALQADAKDLNERLRAKVGDWPQSLRASALINAGLKPQEGTLAQFDAASGRRLVVLEGRGTGDPAGRVVASSGDVRIVLAD